MTDRPARDLKLSPEQLLDDLAQRDEAEATGAPQTNADADSTFKVLKAELDTLASQLREPAPVVPFEDESGCQRITELIEALGVEPTLAGMPRDNAGLADSLPLGDLGQYRLLAKLGEGGMGTVYKALHTRLDKVVALKVLPTERTSNSQAVARFEREMRAVGKLEHPNIVRAMDANEHAGTHYLVMEYVDGVDLSELVHRLGPLPVADACELVRQAAVGLQNVHEHKLVHRDIKPSNLMLNRQGQVKILDLGLARLHEGMLGELTSAGQMMGTIDYMAPEQTGDSHDVDIRADIYGLGASLFKLLCDRAPYADKRLDTVVKKLKALATKPVPSVRELRGDVPAELNTIVRKMLGKEPEERYATPQQVAEALKPFAEPSNLPALAASYEQRLAAAEPMSQPVLSSTEQYLTNAMTETKTTKMDDVSGSPAAVSGLPTEPLAPTEGLHAAGRPTVGSEAGSGDPSPASGSRPATGGIANRNRLLAIAAAFGGIILLGAVTLFFLTSDGTIVVEIDDPEGLIQVAVVGQDIVISEQQKEGEPIKLRPGDHKLHVTRGELEFDSDNFTLKRGERIVLNVKLADGHVNVVHDTKVIGQRDLPATPGVDRDRAAASAMLALGGRVQILRDGDGGNPWVQQLPDEPFHLIEVDLTSTGAHVSDEHLRVLAGLTKLQVVRLGYQSQAKAGLTDAGLAHFAEVSTLRSLDLSHCPNITDAGLKHLANLTELVYLSLDMTRVTGVGLAHLQNCHKLRELRLWGCPITDEGLAALPDLPALGWLDLTATLITDTRVGRLQRFPHLHTLLIGNVPVTVEVTQNLERLRSLKYLTIGSPQPAKGSWRNIAALTQLNYLSVNGGLTDEDLQWFGTFPELVQLHLYANPITDAGLEHLSPLKALRDLRVDSTSVTATGVARLKSQLPECQIQSDFTNEQIAAAIAAIDVNPFAPDHPVVK